MDILVYFILPLYLTPSFYFPPLYLPSAYLLPTHIQSNYMPHTYVPSYSLLPLLPICIYIYLTYMEVGSSVGIVLGYGLTNLGSRVRFPAEAGIFLFTTASRTSMGPTQPTIQWVSGALSLGLKRPEREADHLSPSSAKVKECVEPYLHSPNTPSWLDAQLKKHRDNFTFYLYLYYLYGVGVEQSV
jgi:hypothetical protein